MSLIIAGERSGVGKTTITLALLAYLRQRSQGVQSFKVGPDYIDPMFHGQITQRPCYNLDPVLTSEAYVQQSFARHSEGVKYAVVEGVMGLFDGALGTSDLASTAHVARLLSLPVVLVIDCARMSRSVAAIAHGYRSFDPRVTLAGVVLNRVGSDRHLTLLQEALAPLNLPILGVLRRQEHLSLPARHLGLVPTAELPRFGEWCDRLITLAAESFDWPLLLPLLAVPQSAGISPPRPTPAATRIPLAIARDRAFSFYYADNLATLEALGADLCPWSPLTEAALPEGVAGLYLGGGFPELFAAELVANGVAQTAVRTAIARGLPVYAECGGLMYLSQAIVDFEGQSWPMVGALPTVATMGDRLTLGYRQATALQDSPLIAAGTQTWGHEFHRSSLTIPPSAPLFSCQRADQERVGTEGWRSPTLHASYLHVHWGDRPDLPQRFLRHCQTYAQHS